MATLEELKEEIAQLIKSASDLEQLMEGPIINFNSQYQVWYTKAIKVVEVLAGERLKEFISYYERDPKRKELFASNYTIQDYIMAVGARSNFKNEPLWDTKKVVFVRLVNQVSIINSLYSRIDSVFSDIRGAVFSDLLDKELETAKNLLKINIRASGAFAGVILESHLQKVMLNHGIQIKKKNPTISDMNDPLKQNNVYDTAIWRKVQYLADIRNLCSHKKDDNPTIDQVKELLLGTNAIIKTVF